MFGNIFCCLFVMLPLAYILGLRLGLGLVGIWGAMCLSWGSMAILYLVILYRTDWNAQVTRLTMIFIAIIILTIINIIPRLMRQSKDYNAIKYNSDRNKNND